MEGDEEVISSDAESENVRRPWVKTLGASVDCGNASGSGGFFTQFILFINTLWSFIVIHLIGLKFTLIELCTPHRPFWITDAVMEANQGRWAVVTGGTRGIGLEVVRKLYQSRMNVIIGCRNVMRGYQIGCLLHKEFGFGKGDPVIHVLSLDLNSLFSVKFFALRVRQITGGSGIHVLVNNAAVMFPAFKLSENGLGRQMQTNHLSHFSLIHKLMQELQQGGKDKGGTFARVVNVSSVAHYGATVTEECTKTSILSRSNDFQIYMDSKFCQIVTSMTWNRTFKAHNIPVQILNVHPGIVNTKLYKNVFYYRLVAPLLPYFYKSPRQGADCVVFAALSPTLEGQTPAFLMNSEEREPLRRVRNTLIQNRIWYQSCLATETPHEPFKV